MAGLWIAHIEVSDEETYGHYVAGATEVLKEYGGQFVARGGRYEQLEGTDHSRNVVVKFDTFEQAVACYKSDAYQAIVGDAISASNRSVVVVEADL